MVLMRTVLLFRGRGALSESEYRLSLDVLVERRILDKHCKLMK